MTNKSNFISRAVSLITCLLIVFGQCSFVGADVGQPELVIPMLGQINCISYCVYDKTENAIILSKEENTQIYPASMTKILSAQLGLDYLDVNSYLTVSQNAIDNVTYDSTLMGVSVGEQLQVSELLYGMMLPSGNDAANVVAEGVIDALFENYPEDSDEVGPDGINASYFVEKLGASVDEILEGMKLSAFAELMNLRAANLGCQGSHFTNANGLHNDNHYSTASDLTLIMANACLNEDFNTIISSPTHILQHTNYHVEDGWSILKNTNNLLQDPWLCCTTAEGEDTHMSAFIGGKTGTTSMAGTGMTVYTVNENGHELFISVCGIDNYAYQTRYVASVTAYGNLECWNLDPVPRIPGTTGDYRRFNSTDNELPIYDPLIVPGDDVFEFDAESIAETEITEATSVEETTSETRHEPTRAPEKTTKELLVDVFKANFWAVTAGGIILVLIIVCITLLISRIVSINRRKKKRKVRNSDQYIR